MKPASTLVDENRKLRRQGIPYDMEKLAYYSQIDEFVTNKAEEQAKEDEMYRKYVDEHEVEDEPI